MLPRSLRPAVLMASLLPMLAAQDPMITEFMASNSSGLLDQDGEPSDWIELHNPRSSDLDLAGWHLTDDKNLPTKWTFPKTILVAGSHLVVFASAKDRRVGGKELHTNFSLAAEGEYLALYTPGGQRVAAEFAPKFPPQLVDISYGSPSGNLEPLKADVPCQATVPTNNSLGQLWTQLNWQPKNWLAGRTGAGYSRNLPYGSYNKLDLDSVMYGRNTSAYLRVPFQVTGARTLGLLELTIFYNDGFVAYLNGTEIARSNAPAKPVWNSKATASRTWVQSFLEHRINISHHLS
ncbi:MAG: lamin tail domain-containing protein, partial [Planctomycetota bacterium]|nr:lamin tail domain-containing protein [Planctomycetota bacterium]